MEEWDINCCKCGKFILREQRGADNEIRCIEGNYEDGYYDGYYDGLRDEFWCRKCAENRDNKMER